MNDNAKNIYAFPSSRFEYLNDPSKQKGCTYLNNTSKQFGSISAYVICH